MVLLTDSLFDADLRRWNEFDDAMAEATTLESLDLEVWTARIDVERDEVWQQREGWRL